jgi:CubicO group peptidase (beta-lactamase class C family)
VKRLLATAAILATLATSAGACTSDTETPDEVSGAPAVGASDAPACPPELDEAFGAWAEAGFSGTIAVMTAGEPDCLAAYGTADAATGAPNTVDTVFAIGSVSKAFTAAAVYGLVDDGKLAPTDRAGDLVPGLVGPAADATVEQLLVHTAGLTGDHGADHQPLDHDEAVAAIGDLPPAFPPGTDYLYSNAGYTLLALIVEEASGTDYREFLASRVLALPGGAVAGGFWDGAPPADGPRAVGVLDDGSAGQAGDFAGPHWAMAGNGDLAMTTRDLAAWTDALFTGEIVSPSAAAAIAAPGFDHGDGSAETPGWVALDASAFGEPVLAASGGGGDTGQDAVVAWLPESERVLAVAANTPDVRAEDLLVAVGPALVAGEVPPLPDGPAGQVDPDESAALEGTYTLAGEESAGGGTFAVAPHDDGLSIAASGAAAVNALFPLPKDITADATAHEDDVRSLLAGDSDAGREEREAVESDFGPIEEVEVVGTIVEDGELRTYVTITAGGEPVTGWYALDEQGGIAAVDLAAGPPTLVVAPAGGGTFRPVDPTGRAPAVTVGFGDDTMTVAGPAGTTTASLSG